MKNKRVIALFLATTLLISPIQQVYAENVSDSGITDNTESTDELQESTNEVESPKEGDNLSEKENDNTQQDGNPEGNSSDEKNWKRVKRTKKNWTNQTSKIYMRQRIQIV